MIQLKLSTGLYLVFPLPEGASNISISDQGHLWYRDGGKWHNDCPVSLPTGNWQLIATTKSIAMDDIMCQNFFDEEVALFDQTVGFPDFMQENCWFVHWGEDMGQAGKKSFSSLCQYHHIPENSVWLKKTK